MANEEQSKATVEKFMKTFSEGDIDGVAAGLADGAGWWVLGSIEGLSGSYSKEEMIAALPNFKTLYKAGALELRPQSMIAEGNRVAVEAEGFAELSNGRVYNSLYHFVFEVEGDKVTGVKEYLDTHHAHAIFFVE
jgi:ketosteroid isomerase-like protein